MITISEGRAAYNLSRVRVNGDSLEIRTMNSHEAAVAAFFKECEKERPVETARVFRKHPVLNEEQLKYRRAQELYAFGPVDDEGEGDSRGYGLDAQNHDAEWDGHTDGSGQVPDMYIGASLVRHREQMEARSLAERRGEPYGGV